MNDTMPVLLPAAEYGQARFRHLSLVASLSLFLSGWGSAMAEEPSGRVPSDRCVPFKARTVVTGKVTARHLNNKNTTTALADAIIYLDKTVEPSASTPAMVQMTITDAGAVPRHIVATPGQPVIFLLRTQSPYFLTFSSANEERQVHAANLRKYEQRQEKVFDKAAEFVYVTSPMNPKFRAYITVVPNGNFVRTDKDGCFRLPLSFEPGEYNIRANHPDYGVDSKRIVIDSEQNGTKIDFLLSKKR